MPKTQNDTDDNTDAAKDGKRIDGGRYRHRENTTNEIWGKEMAGKYLTARTGPGGPERRQIDYITSNAKYRGAARTARRNTYWHASMNQNQQHRVLATQLYYNDAKKYKKPAPSDTGAILKYDIRELRRRPEKLTKWHQEQETEVTQAQQDKEKRQKPDNATQEWRRYQGELGKALRKIYSLKKTNIPGGTRMGSKTRRMGARPNRQITARLFVKEKNRTPTRDWPTKPEAPTSEKCTQLQQISHPRKQAERYTKTPPRRVGYSRRPIIDLTTRTDAPGQTKQRG